MNTINPADFVTDQWPRAKQSLIPTTLKTAYLAVEQMVADEPILQVQSAQDNKGRLISWAVDLGFQRLIDSGSLPFDYRWVWFSQPTGKYLEIRLSHSVVTVVDIPAFEPQDHRTVHYSDDKIEEVAEQVREHCGLGLGPISNVLRLLKAKGILVCRLQIPNENIEVFSFWRGSRPFIFLASDKESAARARFDLAQWGFPRWCTVAKIWGYSTSSK